MISVVVPVYNEGEAVFALVSHLERLENLGEIILVDASDQPSSLAAFQALADRGSREVLCVRSPHPGRAVQMNLGAESARGDVLLFLHCDSRLPDDALQQVRHAMDSGYCWGRFDIRLDAPGFPFRLIERMINLRSRLQRIATGDQGIFVRNEVFTKCGGYPDLKLMEDIALSDLLRSQGRPFVIAGPLVSSARRWRNCGVVSTVTLMWKLRFLYWLGIPAERLSSMYGNER